MMDEIGRTPYIPVDMETLAPAAPKGRPREFCVDAALAAALQVFWRKGFEAASLTDLTEAMGVTRPSLYAAFGNKESLFRKALDLYEREKLAYVSAALEAPSARQVAERLLLGAWEMQTSNCDPHGCMGVIASVSCAAQSESIKDDVLARKASSDAALLRRFERAEADGDLPTGLNAAGLSRYLSALLQGLSVQAGAGASPEDLRQLVDTSLSIWPTR
jgi:AcrR family transcriptional regulator